MKSEKGVTLVSLIVYVIVMTIAVAIVALVSSYFYSNIDVNNTSLEPLTEYTRFNSFFTDEMNRQTIRVLECKDNYIVFDNEVQYTYIPENKGIYRNKVKICRGVEECKFEYKIENGKNVIILNIKIGDETVKTTKYTLKN